MASLGLFLKGMDSLAKGDDFIGKVIKFLGEEGVEITEVCDLDGCNAEMVISSIRTNMSTVTKSFTARAIMMATNHGQPPTTPIGGSPSPSMPMLAMDGFENFAAWSDFLGQKRTAAKKVHYMLGPDLEKIRISNLSKDAWSDGQAMNAAVAEGMKRVSLLAGAGTIDPDEPFVFADFRTFEPKWCKTNEGMEECDGAEDLPKVKSKQRQPRPRWNVAYHNWAIFASARGHFSLAKAIEHNEVCQMVAFRAHLGSKPRKAALDVVYDE